VSRGKVLSLTPAEVVARALSLCVVPDDESARIYYCNEPGKNGGADPEAITCASLWRDRKDTKEDPRGRLWATADCCGLAFWALGMDRFQPPLWLTQNSVHREATAKRGWRFCDPRPGCIAGVVDGKKPDGSRRIGHVGIVTRQQAGVWYVVHCSPSNHKRVGQGIAETTVRVAMGARPVYFAEPT
jgi:hypothetical protein